MINKNKFSIKDTKKVLHKVGKRWVVVSAVLLGLAAGGAAVTTANANAANTSVGTEETAPDNMNSAQIANYESKIQYYRNKGIMNDTLNGVGNHIKPKMANSADSTAYSNAVNMVRPASLAKLSAGSGEQLGTVTNPSSNTWFGSLSYAENQAKTFTNNDSKYQKALGILNGELNNTTLPTTTTIKKLSNKDLNTLANGQDYSNVITSKLNGMSVNYLNTINTKVNTYLSNNKSSLKSELLDKLGMSMFANDMNIDSATTKEGSNGTLKFSLKGKPNVSVNITSPSNNYTFDHPVQVNLSTNKNNQPLTVANAINYGIKLTIPSNITVNGLSGNVSVNDATIIPEYTVPVTIVASGNIMGQQTQKTETGELYLNQGPKPKTDLNPLHVYVTDPKTYITVNNDSVDLGSMHVTGPFDFSNETLSKSGLSTTIYLSNRSYTSQRIADILADSPAVQSDAIDSMISSQIKSHAETLSPTKADSYISDAVDVISAGNEMLKNPNMESVYSNAVNNIANLPNDNESGEYADLNNAAKNANALSVGYGTATTSNSRAGSVFTHAANAATSAATSMSNAMSTINTDSINVNNDVNNVATYSGNLNKDIALGGKPVSDNASNAMSGDYTDVKHDNTIASNAQSAYSDWADTDDAFNVTNANNASANASTTADNAKGLVNVEFSASFNYMNGSKSVGNGTFSTTVSNPSSALSKTPTSTVTNMPAGYKLSNGANDVITLNGTPQSIEVVSASSAQPTNNKVTETFYFSGDGNASAIVSGSANTLGSVSAPSGYTFLDGGSLAKFTYGTSDSSMTVDVVPASTNVKPANNKVTETFYFNGDGNASAVVSGSANTLGSVSAPSGYSFLGGGSLADFTYGTSNGSMTVDVVSASTSSNNQSSSASSNASSTNSKANNNSGMPFIPSFNGGSSMASSSVSASVEPSASAEPTSTTNNNISSIATKKHAANYAKVVKALQLHTNPNFTKRNAIAVIKPGTTFKIEKAVKDHKGVLRYEVRYNKKNYFITANKHLVNAYYKAAKHANNSVNNYVHYRYAQVIKSLQLHTNAKFTKRNGVKVVRPNTEFHINHIVKNHGLVRYEVRYQGHNYFITANHYYTVNAYLQKYNFRKHGYKAVRVIKPMNEYRKLSFAKRSLVRHVYRGSVLPVKKVITIASGEMTRLQLTNGHYVSANKDLVKVIK